MNEEIRRAIGLLRHQIISPVLMETRREQMSYFRKVALSEYLVPGVGMKRFAPETMKGWLKKYKKHGFTGIMPKQRTDTGRTRAITPKVAIEIRKLRDEYLEVSIAKFYRICLKATVLGHPPICQQTLRRYLQSENLFPTGEAKKGRRRYEMDYFGELWVGDFMHGPVLKEPRQRKAILLGIIDDHSRMIVGHRWSFEETTLPIEVVFKEALLRYGKPNRLYVDNGPSFSGDYLRSVCAPLGIGLIHSKPYDSPSRGKIERFWRTVRESFLSDFKGQSLQELNKAFDIWLREYHANLHSGIGCRPLDRYQMSIAEYPRPRVSEEEVEEHFLVTIERKVNRDSTISFHNLIYEVPVAYIGRKVQIRYSQDNPRELYLYDNNERITALKVVDARANGKSYRPRERNTVIPYQEKT